MDEETGTVSKRDFGEDSVKDVECIIVNNEALAEDMYHMRLDCMIPASIPGQFVMVRVGASDDPFLRRPLAIFRHNDSMLELLYKPKGKGTILLSQMKPGRKISVLGPLGNGFGVPDHGQDIIYIAGGTGLPPMLALSEHIRRGMIFVGVRSKTELGILDKLGCLDGDNVMVSTQDGSYGYKGLVTDLVQSQIDFFKRPFIIYACGPIGMLKATKAIATGVNARCEISLEERMACGFGVCSGCIVNTCNGNKRVCRDGPVFDANDVILE